MKKWWNQFLIDLGIRKDTKVTLAQQRQRNAGKRLGIDVRGLGICDYNALIMNRIADLEERLEAHESKNAAQSGPDG